jgi:predicted ABC-type transport system involved in lysophospholipase L1 biosynthesis ATPase subunit
LFPTLTAAENVRLSLDVRGDRSRAARAKANQALASVGSHFHARSLAASSSASAIHQSFSRTSRPRRSTAKTGRR